MAAITSFFIAVSPFLKRFDKHKNTRSILPCFPESAKRGIREANARTRYAHVFFDRVGACDLEYCSLAVCPQGFAFGKIYPKLSGKERCRDLIRKARFLSQCLRRGAVTQRQILATFGDVICLYCDAMCGLAPGAEMPIGALEKFAFFGYY